MLPSTEVLRRWRVSCICRCSTACNNSVNVACKIDGFVGCLGWVVGIKWLLYGRPRSRTSRELKT
uniref:MIP20232p n=1 Tax=Drosophila melanogaster TaxID=7227 RepID=D5A7P2_DROME|eukprot:NP_001247174.1 uncharacterized protein Dmel_CG43445 [Drosophila melanogaster]